MSNLMKRGPAFERPEPVRKRRRFNYMAPSTDPMVKKSGELAKISINKVLSGDSRRIETAKQYLAAVEHDFLKDNENDSDNNLDLSNIHSNINKKLLEDVYKKESKFYYKYGLKLKESIELNPNKSIFIKSFRGHRLSVTCMDIDINNRYCVTGSKDGSIIKWDLITGKKVNKVWHAWPLTNNKRINSYNKKRLRPKAVLSIAISPDNKYMVTGGEDCLIRVWLYEKFNYKATFRGHRNDVTGLAFSSELISGTEDDIIDNLDDLKSSKNITLFSCSKDRQIRVYDMNELGFSEPLFGHTLKINNICSISDDRCITVSDDRTIRYWRLKNQSQLIFKNGHLGFIDSCILLNSSKFVSGGTDGNILLWSSSKKYPLYKELQAHKSNNGNTIHWITSLGCKINSDIFISGDSNGIIKLWFVNKNKFNHIRSIKIPNGGYINCIKLTNNGNTIICGIGNEHRLGRWNRIKSVKNGICIIQLPIDCNNNKNEFNKINKNILNKELNNNNKINQFLEEDSNSENENYIIKQNNNNKNNKLIEYLCADHWDRWSPKEKGMKEKSKLINKNENISKKQNKIENAWQEFFGKVYN